MIKVLGPRLPASDVVLTPAALGFVESLHREFAHTREHLLAEREDRQSQLDQGVEPEFVAAPNTDWKVEEVPPDLADRRVEITGPVERKMMINALNSGAKVFMADFEDSNSPTWENVIQGQGNLIDTWDRSIEFTSPEGKQYRLGEEIATLLVRPRGWHLAERHLEVDGRPACASLVDFGLYFFHCAARSLALGSGPYFYLPKLESHLEARLWNQVFLFSQAALGLPTGTIKATVLIETITAAFEMDAILFELKGHSSGLNAGRWDYLFSIIKKFRNRPGLLFPDRAQLAMTVPFMRAYTDLLVQTCHRRGAHAIGGMAAFIPNRREPEVTQHAINKVAEDKRREAGDGFDGTWVAHPDLVTVAKAEFDRVLGSAPHQRERTRPEVRVEAKDLLDFSVPGGTITEAGLRTNVGVGISYLASWLRGVGAAAINNLMEDVATAEISRSQVWQWVHNHAQLEGRTLDEAAVQASIEVEMNRLQSDIGADAFQDAGYPEARRLFEQLALGQDFEDFLTIPAYQLLEKGRP